MSTLFVDLDQSQEVTSIDYVANDFEHVHLLDRAPIGASESMTKLIAGRCSTTVNLH